MNTLTICSNLSFDRFLHRRKEIAIVAAEAILNEAQIFFLAKSAVENSADPTDALIILLSGPLSQLHGRPFVPEELVQKATAFYGWSISADVIEFVIPRMRAKGWLTNNGEMRGPLYVNLPDPISGESNSTTVNELAQLGRAFANYSRELSPFSALPEDEIECATIAIRYAVKVNASETAERLASDQDYVCARFLEHINENDAQLTKLIGSLSALGFLSFISEDFSKPQAARASDLKVIVDGPVLLDYLECSGKARAEAPRKLFDDLRKLGCQIVTFAHCVREAQRALKTVLRTDRAQRYGPTGDALKRGLVREDRLEAIHKNFEAAIKQSKITILPDTVALFPNSHQFFTADQAQAIMGMINWHDGENEDAIFADADTITLTIRRRGGHRTTDVFDSKFVAVTNNSTFFGATRRFLSQNFVYSSSQVPPVISLQELAAKTWLEVGAAPGEGAALAFSHVLLSCERSLRLNEEVVNRARQELSQISEEKLAEFELLLNVPRSVRALVDKTLNNENYVTSDSIEGLVDAAIHAAAETVSKQEKQKRTQLKAEYENKIANHLIEVENERLRRESAENRNREMERSLFDGNKEIVRALVARSQLKFRSSILWIRIFGVFSFVSPIILFFLQPKSQWNPIVGVITLVPIIASLLTLSDYPGHWVSNWLKSKGAERVSRELERLGRRDIVNDLELRWDNETLEFLLKDKST